jgi:D-alanine--poly(phosphoribitol) ligase subunit 2
MEEKILGMLEEICEDDVIREERDMDLFEAELLDSLGFAELLVTIEEEFGIVIAPSEVKREDMNTVNKILEMLEKRA